MFDWLVLLAARPGRSVYQGPMEGVTAYFERCGFPMHSTANVADMMLDLVTPGAAGADPDKLCEVFKDNSLSGIMKAVNESMLAKGSSAMDLLNEERNLYLQFGSLPPITRGPCSVSRMVQFKTLFDR